MNRGHLLLLFSLGLVSFGCSNPQHTVGTFPPGWTPPGAKHDPERERYVENGWPFPVHADIRDGDFTQEPFDDLRGHFLRPIAESHHASQIKEIRINAEALEADAWTCSVVLKDNLGSIDLNHFGAFYRTNDPHQFESATRYVVSALSEIHLLTN